MKKITIKLITIGNKAISLLAVVLVAVTVFSAKVDAAANTIGEVGKTFDGLEEFSFELEKMKTNAPNATSGTCEEEGGHLGTGKEYVFNYPGALSYFGEPITVTITLTGEDERAIVWENGNKPWIETPGLSKANVDVVVDFTDKNGDPFVFNGIFTFRDPDQSNYLFSTSGRDVYYTKDVFNFEGEGHGTKKLEDYYEVTSYGIRHITSEDWPNFDGGYFGIQLNESSFSFTVESNENYLDIIYLLSGFYIDKVPYEVQYYYEQEDGSYKLDNTVERAAKSGETVSVTDVDKTPTKEDYVRNDEITDKNYSETVKSDGSTVLKVYFDLNDAPYTVEYYYEQSDGTYTLDDSVKRTAIVDETVSVTDTDKTPTKDGYELNDEKEEKIYSDVNKKDGSTVLKVYFDFVEYTVTYKPGTQGTFPETVNPGLHYGDDTPASPETTGYPGYKFVGWDIEVADVVTGDAVYVAQWEAIDVKYRVETYYEIDGEYKETPDTSDVREAKTDTTVEVTEDDKTSAKENYVIDEEAEEKLYSDNVNGDGSTVLKVYFKKLYTVIYKDGADGEVFVDETNPELEYGVDTPACKSLLSREGYDFNGWSPELEKTVTKDATYVANWEPWKYTIKYNANGGSGTMDDQVFTFFDEKMVSKENKFTRDGYKFIGFVYTDNDGKVSLCKNPEDFRDILVALGKNKSITLIAQWEKNPERYVEYIIPVTGVCR